VHSWSKIKYRTSRYIVQARSAGAESVVALVGIEGNLHWRTELFQLFPQIIVVESRARMKDITSCIECMRNLKHLYPRGASEAQSFIPSASFTTTTSDLLASRKPVISSRTVLSLVVASVIITN
jgi:hypothetical protein